MAAESRQGDETEEAENCSPSGQLCSTQTTASPEKCGNFLFSIQLHLHSATPRYGHNKMPEGVLQDYSLVERIIDNLERKLANPHCVDLKQACEMIAFSWRRVKPEAIRNCWRKAGFVPEDGNDSSDPEYDMDMEPLSTALSTYSERVGEHMPPAEEYLSVDDEVVVFPELTDENILEEFQSNKREGEDIEEDEEEEELIINRQTLTPAEAIASCEALQNFLSTVPSIPESHLVHLDAIRSLCVSLNIQKKVKQTTISEFFKKC